MVFLKASRNFEPTQIAVFSQTPDLQQINSARFSDEFEDHQSEIERLVSHRTPQQDGKFKLLICL